MRTPAFVLTACLALAAAGTARCADGKLGVELIDRDGRVVILSVLPGSNAEDAGIMPGYVLVKVGNTRITSVEEALDAKAAAPNNKDIRFVFNTPDGLWHVDARFEKGKAIYAPAPKPKKN